MEKQHDEKRPRVDDQVDDRGDELAREIRELQEHAPEPEQQRGDPSAGADGPGNQTN